MSTDPKVIDMTSMINRPIVEVSGTCETHGDYQASVLVIKGVQREPECPSCLQLKIRAEHEAEARALSTESEQKGRKQRLERIGLPPRMADVRWRDYVPATNTAGEFKSICREYATNWEITKSEGANLIMTGKTGNGKTHLASVLCKQVAAENTAQPIYATASQMLRYVRGSYNDSGYTEDQALNRYALADLLVLDEVGVKLSSDSARSMLFEVVDIRYQERLPTIMISNLSVGEIEEQVDERMVDRLSENGTLMVFDWASHRGRS